MALAMESAWQRGILHCDVTPMNFGHDGGHGFLYDFSVGEVGGVALQRA